MSEMIERVALATRKKVISMDPGKWPEMEANPNAPLHPLELEIARAAIVAMREPTEAMNLAGNAKFPCGTCSPKFISPLFTAMIDAALK